MTICDKSIECPTPVEYFIDKNSLYTYVIHSISE
jgi:hypothetical protein